MALMVVTIWRRWDFDIFFGAIGWLFGVKSIGVVIIVLLNFGHVYAVALFRYLVFALAAAALGTAMCAGTMLAVGGMPHADRTASVVVLVSAAFMLPSAAVLIRGLLRVRWLDPASRGSEWEPQPLPERPT